MDNYNYNPHLRLDTPEKICKEVMRKYPQLFEMIGDTMYLKDKNITSNPLIVSDLMPNKGVFRFNWTEYELGVARPRMSVCLDGSISGLLVLTGPDLLPESSCITLFELGFTILNESDYLSTKDTYDKTGIMRRHYINKLRKDGI